MTINPNKTKTKTKFEPTQELVTKVLKTVDAGLSNGLGSSKPGSMCVEAAVCYAMGLPHGDNPPCVHPVIRGLKIRLNDSQWSSKKARAKGMRRLAVLQLGTADCGFDAKDFAKRLALFTIKTILPIALAAAGLQDHADKCAAVVDLAAARAAAYAAAYAATDAAADAAAYAATDAARAAAYAAADAAYAAADAARAAYAATDAARAAAYAAADAAAYAATDAARAAAYAAAYAAKKDEVLGKFAAGVEDILIEMKVPAVEFLELTVTRT